MTVQLSRIDRNRIRVAALISAVVLPVAFIAGGRPADSVDGSVPAATTTTLDVGLNIDAAQDAPANADGPSSNRPNGQGAVAYPAQDEGSTMRGVASFKQFPTIEGNACTTNAIPLGAVITVRNLNNGRKVVCTNLNAVYVPPGFDIVLNIGTFTDIADLIDAPLPVELSW
ncbi:MAG: hypothetical protein RLZZ305_1188 [Actinomycetota bacterium]|jgi:hypothetical protein